MSNGTPDELDSDQLLSRIVEFDEALAAGRTVDFAADETLRELPDPTRKRFERVLHCLQFLDEVRRVRKATKGNGAARPGAEASADSSSKSSEVRLKIGRFEVLRELGRGGHGVVFLAIDTLLGRQVALKVPRPEFILSPGMSRRFVTEAQAAAALDHPNILRVFEAGSDGAIPFIAQELCTGPPLADWLRESADGVDPRIAAAIVRDLARAVEHAHKRGVLHRDLKPGNVLLQPVEQLKVQGSKFKVEDGADSGQIQNPNCSESAMAESKIPNPSDLPYVAKLADFGIAKVFDEGADNTDTMTGAAIGTVAYMSPEQAAGKSSQIGPSSDVYGLGAILYELLTGQAPFRLDSRMATLQRVMADEPAAPCSLQPKIPRDLEAICLKCLEKRPEDRYQTAVALAADLDRFLAGEAVGVRPIGKVQRIIRRIRRLPVGMQIAFTVIALLVGSLLASVSLLWTSPRLGTGQPSRQPLDPESEYLSGINRVSQGYFDAVANRGDVKTAVRELDTFLERHRPAAEQADYRGFEWHYLWRLCHPDKVAKPFPKLFDLVGHQGQVYHVCFSSDGTRIATCGQDRTGRIWDAGTGKLLMTLRGHTDDVNWISFHPTTSSAAVTASDDKTVRIWNCESGKEWSVLSGHNARVVVVEVANVESRQGGNAPYIFEIISGDDDGRIVTWEWNTRRQLRSFQAHGNRIEAIARIRGGEWWMTASSDGTAREWNAINWNSPRTHTLDGCIRGLSCSSDGAVAALAWGPRSYEFDSQIDAQGNTLGGHVAIDDIFSQSRWLNLVGPPRNEYASVQFYPGRYALVAVSREPIKGGVGHRGYDVVFWDVGSQKYWNAIREEHLPCWSAAFSPDGTRMAIAGLDGVVRVWDSSTLPCGTRLNAADGAIEGPPRSASFSPDGQKLLVTHCEYSGQSRGSSLDIWDLSTAQPAPTHLNQTGSEQGGSAAACFSADARLIAVDLKEPIKDKSAGRVALLDAESLRPVGRSNPFEGVALRILFSPNGKHLVAVTGDAQTTLRQSATSKRTRLQIWATRQMGRAVFDRESLHRADFLATALSPDGTILATNRERVELYEFPSMRLVVTLPVALGTHGAVRFSPDGQTIACGGEGGEIHISDVRGRREVKTLRCDDHGILSLAFSSDGVRLAAGVDGAPRIDLWHVPSRTRLTPLLMPSDIAAVTDLSFSPDQKTLAAVGGGDRGCVFLFPLAPVESPAIVDH